MAASALWEFAQERWHVVPLRRALMRFQNEFQQSACLLLALAWLSATQRAPTAALIQNLRNTADDWEQRMAPLRRLLSMAASDPDQADWQRALLRAQLEGEKLLLATLQTLIDAQALPLKPVSLEVLVLQALPEIGFCEGQTQLLAELVESWRLQAGQ